MRWAFWMPSAESSAGGSGVERQPLLPSKQGRGGGEGDTQHDAIDHLERLPVLLVRAVAIFTVALVGSTLLGAVSSVLHCL